MFTVYHSLLPLHRDQGSGGLISVTPSRDGSSLCLGLIRLELDVCVCSSPKYGGRFSQTLEAGCKGLALSLFTRTLVLGPGHPGEKTEHPGATRLEEAML